MDIGETLYVPTRAAWRAWLTAHHDQRREIWLVSYRTGLGKPSVGYNDAVEEALCFGWIDSIRKGLDAERYAHRYTPRRPGSTISQTNLERLARLIQRGQVLPQVLDELGPVRPDAYRIPADIAQALRAEPGAWAFFCTTSPAYQRIRSAYVDSARNRPDLFQKRLDNLVRQSARGKQFGYGIEEYY